MLVAARKLAVVALLFALGGCTSLGSSGDTGGGLFGGASRGDQVEMALDVRAIEVIVPRSLTVSEANTLKPRVDIVWRGDPPGDRHRQVADLVRACADSAAAGLTQGIPVMVSIEITRFHALTQRARYSTGGDYEVDFILTIRNAETGAVIDGPRKVKADLPAWGAERAIEEDNAGITEKMIMTDHLTKVLTYELTHPVLAPQG